jgi:hypothetical protein
VLPTGLPCSVMEMPLMRSSGARIVSGLAPGAAPASNRSLFVAV